MSELNQAVISEFRDNDGRLSGPMAGAPILLLTTTGRRSGRPYTTPVGFIESDGGLVIAAANGGAASNPDWFHNLVDDSRVVIEVPGARIESRAALASGQERVRLLEQLSSSLPGMADHVAATDRDIPVVTLVEWQPNGEGDR